MAFNPPALIMFFGPPTAGKGTQSKIFLEKHPEYSRIDFGYELRSFVKNYAENSSQPERQQLAMRLNACLRQRRSVDAPDLMLVLKDKMVPAFEKAEKLVLDGAGRSAQEAELQVELFNKYRIRPCIFNLFLTKDHILERARNRWFVPDNPSPFSSFEAAQKACLGNQQPFQRQDDLDEAKVLAGYDNLYGNFPNILLIYQLGARAQIFTIDASQSIAKVTEDIELCLRTFYVD